MAVKDGLPSTDFSRMNREYIKAVAGESGGGLPEITEADEGKVLTVESGEAAWATGGGGGEILVCSSTVIPDDPNENMILNKTWEEIASVMANNIPVFVMSIYSSSPVQAITDMVEGVYYDEDIQKYILNCMPSITTYYATTASDYPQTNFGG